MNKRQKQLELLRKRLDSMPMEGMVEEAEAVTDGLDYAPQFRGEVTSKMTQALTMAKERIPKSVEAGPMSFREPIIPDADITRYEGELAMISDPVGTLLDGIETLNLRKGQIDIAQQLYPEIYSYVVSQMVDKITEKGSSVPYKHRLALSSLFGVSLDPSATPAVAAGIAQVSQMASAKDQAQGSRRRQARLAAKTYEMSEMDKIAHRG